MRSWIIGSASDCDIVVNEQSVSSHHCRLTQEADGYYLEDLDSTNGTHVNGKRVFSLRHVTDADSVTLGTQIPLPWPEDAAPVSPPTPAVAVGSFRKPLAISVLVVGVVAASLGTYTLVRQIWNQGEQHVNQASQSDKEKQGSADDSPMAPITQIGFQLGDQLKPEEPIDLIEVRIKIGESGDDLEEPVDLHLGLGFPLRLYPLGTEERTPATAAFAQLSEELEYGETTVAAGDGVSFEFLSQAASQDPDDQDILSTTPTLLADLRVGDIQRIGFAAEGRTNWVLEGYEIQINGKLFASHNSIHRSVVESQARHRQELNRLVASALPFAERVLETEAYLRAGLATDKDRAELEQARQALSKFEESIDRLRGQVEAYYPWYVESAFQPAKPMENLAQQIFIKLLPSGAAHAGSHNLVYLKARGHKYFLTSSQDPLPNKSEWQEFVISAAALGFDPVSVNDLKPAMIGIGMLGGDHPGDLVPDRAQLQRVILEVDGKVVYDSEQQVRDRTTLSSIALIPPAHFDRGGLANQNSQSPRELYLWKPGTEPAQGRDTMTPESEPAPDGGGATAPSIDGRQPTSVGDQLTGRKSASTLLSASSRNGRARRSNGRRKGSFAAAVRNLGASPNHATAIAGSRAKVTDVQLVPRPTDSAIQFGKPCTVRWRVSGPTLRISKFRVRLYPVLPHRSLGEYVPLALQPVAEFVEMNGALREAKLTPELAGIQSQLNRFDPRESLCLYLKAEVTPLGISGRPLAGGAETGPIQPAFPASASVPPIRLIRTSPHEKVQPHQSDFPPASFLIGTREHSSIAELPRPGFSVRATGGKASDWQPLFPTDPRTKPGAWLLLKPTTSQAHVIGNYPGSAREFADHTGIHPPDPTLGDVATIQFATPPGIPLSSDMILVAHLGFLDSPHRHDNQIAVRASIEVYPEFTSQGNNAAQVLQPLLWTTTDAEVLYGKLSNGAPKPLGLIDLPLQLEPQDAPQGVLGASYVHHTTPLPAKLPERANVVVTFMFKWPVPPDKKTRESIGIFGVRLVPQ